MIAQFHGGHSRVTLDIFPEECRIVESCSSYSFHVFLRMDHHDILSIDGFDVIGAGAFIGQHSIFPKVAFSRPDDRDFETLVCFAAECRRVIENGAKGKLKIKGNHPYKKISGVPLHPQGNPDVCNRCGKCVDKCPVGAIVSTEPYKTDISRCMSCGRCIMICPKKTRKYSGLKYRLIGSIFTAAFF